MRFEWLIARRYLWSKRRHPFIGVSGGISILGTAVGVAALIAVLAVMNGFDQDLKRRIIGFRAHLVVDREGVFREWAQALGAVQRVSGVAGVAPYVEGQALFMAADTGSGVLVRGVQPGAEGRVSQFSQMLVQGSLSSEKSGGAVLGSELARKFSLKTGSIFRLLGPESEKPESFTVDGIFSSGLYEYDANVLYLNLADAQRVFKLDGGVSGLSVFLKDAEKAQEAKRRIRAVLEPVFSVRTWMDLNRTLFGALQLEKTVMFLILALIIFVAALNGAGMLTLLVMDKTKDIGILKALGAAPASLCAVFLLDGLCVGLSGAALGLVSGLVLCGILEHVDFVQLPKEIYYLDHLPVAVEAADTLLVFFVAVVLGLVSAFFPALSAARLEPAKALRYE